MTVQDHGTSGDVFATFAAADPAWSPVPLWWWSGERLDPARLRWQLERYVEGGVFNLVVMNLAPTGPLYGKPADDPPFMSEAWWQIFLGVCTDARELGVRLWFYDQIGFSGANVQGRILGDHPEFVGSTLERASVRASGAVSLACPPNGTPVSASVTRLDEQGIATGAPEPVPVIGNEAKWDGDGDIRLSLFYSAPRGFDYFSEPACLTLLDTIHGEFDRRARQFFGDVIVGSFQDELPTMPRWSTAFLETFTQQHGYEIAPWLDALWEDLGGVETRIRRDYHATRTRLAEASFFKPLFDWHEARGLVCGVDQQNPARAGDPKGGVDIYADYMRTHRWYQAPGSDHHGESKIHSSLAHLYGRPRVWIESFHSSGWGGTIEETFDWLVPWLRAGANLYDPHATYYSTRGGWFEWAPPATDWRQPYWSDYRSFSDAVSRLCKILSAGHHVCDVGVLFPTTTVQGGHGLDGVISDHAQLAHDLYLELVGRMVWFNPLTGALDAIGVDFDVLDDDSLATARIDNASLVVAEERFRTVILPGCSVLERDVAVNLVRFLENGGEVIALGSLPVVLVDDPNDRDGLIEILGTRLKVQRVDALGTLLRNGDHLVDAPVQTLVREVGDWTIVFVPAVVNTASDIAGWPEATVDFDRSRYASSATIRVRGVQGRPERWDPFTLTRRSVPESSCRGYGSGVEIDVEFDGSPFALLVFDQSSNAPASIETVRATEHEFNGTWEVEPIPTLDNRWGDFTFPPGDALIPVQRWRWEHRGDGDAWSEVVATYGPRATWSGPGAPEVLIADTNASNFRDAEWSLSRGIHKDSLHRSTLGPSGHVPEEFLDFGKVAKGEAVLVRTTLLVPDVADPALDCWLVIGSAGSKRAWIDGVERQITDDEGRRYQTAIPIGIASGSHEFQLLLTSDGGLALRASYAVTTDLTAFRRPERITAAGEPIAETTLRFETRLTLDSDATAGQLQIATNGAARIAIDGEELGRQGGFMPYGDFTATHPYDPTEMLPAGEHVLAIDIDDIGKRVSVLLDGIIDLASGEQVWLMTDASWSVSRGGQSVPLAIERHPMGDPAAVTLRQRPHPLPATRWLEGDAADDGSVIPIVSAAKPSSTTEWLRCLVPPGAATISIPLVARRAMAELEGQNVASIEDAIGDDWHIELPNPRANRRELTIRVETEPGFSGGAMLGGPATFVCGSGEMALESWEDAGFVDYSGVLSYRTTFECPAESGQRYSIELGDIRGSARVTVNGRDCGSGVVAPFRFDVTDALGETTSHRLEIRIANTLAPYLDVASPTRFVLPGQRRSGLFGPVHLVTQRVAT